ncbi:MAG: acyl--CoA ligase [Desulfobacteraceae bacterium]|nr:acyl--CoA ligase [Desulfobacteraceae bacterium]
MTGFTRICFLLRRLLPRLQSYFCSKTSEPSVIYEVLEHIAAKYPEKDAVVCDNVHMSFTRLKEQADRLSASLSDMGVVRDDRVAIMLPNCPEFVISFLAIAKTGAVVVPVDIYLHRPELETLLQKMHVTSLIAAREFLDIAEPAVRTCHDFKNLILKGLKTENYPDFDDMLKTEKTGFAAPKISPGDILLCLYTSGTTGIPKSVLLNHENVIARGRKYWKGFPLSDSDKCYNLAPLFRGAALFSVLTAGLCYGVTMVIPAAFQPDRIWEQIISENISFFHANPFHFAVLANMPLKENPDLNQSALKLCFSSGNKLPPMVAEQFSDRFNIRIAERYGTVEAGGICLNGIPRQGVRIRLTDEKGNRIKEHGCIGEIVVKTPFMAKEYHEFPELSRSIFKNGWFRTGDIGKIDIRGKLHIICRKKRVVLIKGKEVYPDAVEKVLREHPKVKEALAVRSESGNGEFSLKAVAVLKESCSQEELLEYFNEKSEYCGMLDMIEFRDELPRSWKSVINGTDQAYPVWGEV